MPQKYPRLISTLPVFSHSALKFKVCQRVNEYTPPVTGGLPFAQRVTPTRRAPPTARERLRAHDKRRDRMIGEKKWRET